MSPPAFGVDISAEKLHIVSWPPARNGYHVIDLTDPTWHLTVAQVIQPSSIVAYEPTGWHYSAPLVALLHHLGCTVVTVEHRITGQIRTLRNSGMKKDMTDAQALAYIAAH